jgi:hypothetical protein
MMIWVALAMAAYSLYELFSSENGAELGLSLVRLAVSIVLITAVRSQSEVMISAAVLLNAVAVLAAMVILRKEVQLKNDQR